MTTPQRMSTAAVASLVPWLAFFVAVSVGADGPPFARGAGDVAVFYLAFVAAPSMVPLAAARATVTRLGVLVVMTSVAVLAGWQMATIDDGQAGLAVLMVPFVALPLGVVVWAVETVVAHRRAAGHGSGPSPAAVSARAAALTVDVALAAAVLVVPLTMLSHAALEVVAALVGVVGAAVYLAGLLGPQGRTVGQSLLGLTVVDGRTMAPLSPGRALLRGSIVVIEVATVPTLLVCVPVAELVSVQATGLSLTDRVLRTAVVTGTG